MRNTILHLRAPLRAAAALLLACPLTASLVGCDDDSSDSDAAAFAGWEGSWSSYQKFMDEPEVDAAYAAIAEQYNSTYAAESGTTHTAETVEAHWKMLYGTDFAAVDLSGSEAVYYDPDGDELARCTYRALGCQEVFYVGDDNAWQLEPTDDGWSETWCGFEAVDLGCGTYNRLVMTDFHIHDGQDGAHGHLRYGDVRLEDLWGDRFTGHGRNDHYWWPTLVASDMTADEYAAMESANEVENAEYLTY